MPRTLRAVPLGGLPIAEAVAAVASALDGSGDALLPLPPDAAGAHGLDALEPGTALRPGEDDDADPTALVLATSGSTGTPKGALLQASALTASATATHARLGGPGTWLLTLAPHHVAGVQVLVRSSLAGTVPAVVDLAGGFSTDAFVRATDGLVRRTDGRRYTALVPTQLVRLLDAGPAAVAAVASYDAVLVGAAATPPTLLARARTAGVRVVTTYGMSETCGGCVYDGTPLADVEVDLEDGRILLGGPVVARGYRLRPNADAFVELGGRRWFRTDDLGELVDGRLRVTGRADDVIVTGGLKISPVAVEAVISGLPEVSECVVVGVPDAEWGQSVVAVVVANGQQTVVLQQLRAAVTAVLGPAAAPRRLVLVEQLPLRGPGKPDRAAVAALAGPH
ncbi:MAG: o-succinylbenzoate--CoA ligase [Actinomycetota bacterium]